MSSATEFDGDHLWSECVLFEGLRGATGLRLAIPRHRCQFESWSAASSR